GLGCERVVHGRFVSAEMRQLTCHRLAGVAGVFSIEKLQDIVDAGHWRGALFEQLVAAGAHWVEDRSGHHQYLTTLLESEIGRDQCAAFVTRLNNQGGHGYSRDDAIAPWEVHRVGRDTRGKLGDERAGLG